MLHDSGDLGPNVARRCLGIRYRKGNETKNEKAHS